ncbi:MAG TPA: nuclear transport factor 2 family protein [Gemmatimonadales bacterium]
MRLPSYFLLALLACASPSAQPSSPCPCSKTRERTADRAELLRLHERQRAAHLQRRADWLVSEWADSLISVSRGRVSVGNAERGRAGFQEYLDASTFQAWDDIVPPRIRISPDGEMAYVIVEKRVHLTTEGADGAAEAERTRFAWLSVYEKQGGEWRLAAIASTERPDSL